MVAEALVATATAVGVPAVLGRTMGTDCFYEGQARLDGVLCDYSEADKFAFLQVRARAGLGDRF